MTIDAYYTPGWVVQQCIDEVVPFVCPAPHRILEPGAGHGAFVNRLRHRYHGADITAVDIDPYELPEATRQIQGDFLSMQFDQKFDLAIGNPPFSLALEFIKRSIDTSKSVVLLLRQGFLSSQKRSSFFRLHRPSDVFILSNRPQFTGEGSDKADYCFVCWGRPGFSGSTILHWLRAVPLSDRRTKRNDP